MFATQTKNKAETPAGVKPKRAEAATAGKDAPEQNPVWQSLALRTTALQPKLAVSQPDDPDEREADRTADRVMRTATQPSDDKKLSFTSDTLFMTHKGDRCEEKEEKKVQRRELRGSAEPPANAPPIVHQTLRSPGQPLDPATRAFFEPRLGYDFSQVRVHSDAQAYEAARAVKAKAFTVGQDLVFGADQYAPGSRVGQRLLAHELTHVMQQTL